MTISEPRLRVLIAAAFGISGASAEDFYKNKQLRLIAGFPAGNDYDLGARLLVKYLPKYIPGQPTIIVQNMPQAASVAAANYLYTQAPRDGTVLGSFSRNIVNDALTGTAQCRDRSAAHELARRHVAAGAGLRALVHRAGQDAGRSVHRRIHRRRRRRHVLAGDPADGAQQGARHQIPHRRGLSGHGRCDARGRNAASCRALCASYAQFRIAEQLIKDGKLTFLLRAEEAPIPDIPDVPSIFDYAKTDEQRQLMQFVFSSTEFGRPYVFPPEVPKDRVDIMRKAIADAVHDPELLAEAATIKMDMTYTPPDRLEQLVAKLYQTPPAVIETVKALLPNEK